MMFGGSLLAALPKGFFSWPMTEEGSNGFTSLSVDVNEDGEGRKRRRKEGENSDCVGGSRTPTLVARTLKFQDGGDVLPSPCEKEDVNERPLKRLRGQSKILAVPQPVSSIHTKKAKQPQTSEFLKTVPEDVVAHCLSFLGSADDRFALQTTCRLFRDISNSDEMLSKVAVGGNNETGGNGIIQDHDTPATAASALAPFARAGNLEALYM